MKQKGFTLIELMLVLAVLGVVAAFAVPNFNTTVKNNQLRSTTDSFYTAMRFARAESIRASKGLAIVPIANDWKNGMQIRTTDASDTLIREVTAHGKLTVDQFKGNGTATATSTISLSSKGYVQDGVKLRICDDRKLQSRWIEVLPTGFMSVRVADGGC